MRKVLFFISFLIVTSCETLSDIELDGGSNDCIISSFIYPDSNVVVNVYGSVVYGDSSILKPIDDVNVEITLNKIYKSYSHISNGSTFVTFTDVKPSIGDSVEATISYSNKMIKTSTQILSPTTIDSISIATNDKSIDKEIINIYFSDNASTTDYYQILARQKNILSDSSVIYTQLKCEFVSYLFYLNNVDLSISSIGLVDDNHINGESVELPIAISRRELFGNNVKDSIATIEILLYHHTEDYYYYAKSVQSANNYMLLPVFVTASVHSNIEGGLGIFSGMSFDRKEIQIEY